MLSYILPFIVLILIVVFIHEYGHYYFAKKFGVGVTDFSIGFGKEIFGWNDKSGTRWKIKGKNQSQSSRLPSIATVSFWMKSSRAASLKS